MAKDLIFEQKGSRYECELNPTEPITVEVQREEKKDFTVYAHIGDLKEVPIFAVNTLDSIIFELDVPEGVTVKMVSWSPVVSAKSL